MGEIEINEMEELLNVLKEEEKKGRIVTMTVEGPVSYDIEEFCAQPAEGILYDLHRDTLTTATLLKSGETMPRIRLINDYAVGLVIRHLRNKIDNGK
jgi:hypothetical protein